MPSTYTLNNGIELIGTGEQSGSWGDTTNTNFELIDTALDGQVTVTLASAGTSGSPNALPISDGASSDGRNRMIIFNDGADLGATAYVQLTPNDAEKIVYIRNDLSGSRSIIVFQGTYSASNDYEIPAGTTAVIYFNGGGAGAVAANVFNNAYFDSLRLGGVSVTAIIDDDTMATAAATNIPTAESVKAYVDAQVGANNELSEVLANGNTTGGTSISVSSTDNILFGDNNKAIFGAGSDLQIYHNGANSIISNTTGTFIIQDEDGPVYIRGKVNENSIIANADGAVELYHNNALKLATTNTGVDVTGTVTADGLSVDGNILYSGVGIIDAENSALYHRASTSQYFQTTASNSTRLTINTNGDISFYEDTGTTAQMVWDASADALTFGDNVKATFGAGSDLQIYHDGLNSYIDDTATGFLNLRGDSRVRIGSVISGETMAEFIADGAVNLYHNNAIKLATTSTGVDVTGTVTADGLVTDTTNGVKINTGAAVEASWTHVDVTGTSTINVGRSSTWGGKLIIQTDTKNRANFASNGDISFYEDTGTTPKFFWDASAESLKLGHTTTTFGDNELDLVGDGNGVRSGMIWMRSGTGDSVHQINVNGSTLEFGTGGVLDTSPNVSISSIGNVGIGTSSPASALNVVGGQAIFSAGNGTANLGVQIKGETLTAIPSAQTQGYIAIGDSTIGVAGDLLIAPRTSATANIRFVTGTSPAERLRIDSSGRVGIGTTLPNYKLVVSDGGAAGIEFGPEYSGDTNLIQHYDRIANAYMDVNNIAQNHRFGRGANEWMRITPTGNVGIGTSTPTYGTVEVSKSSVGSHNMLALSVRDGTYNPRVIISHDTTTSSHLLKFDSSYSSATGYADFAFMNGNVGIGTTSPSFKLEVDSVSAQNVANFIGTSGAYVRLTNDTGQADLGSTGNSLLLRTAGTERMRITSTGLVGIGTSSPAGYLHVAGTDPFNLPFRVENTAAATSFDIRVGTGVTFLETNGAQPLGFATNNTERMRIDASGNLLVAKTSSGIGTVGHQIQSNGLAQHTANGSEVLQLNRLTSDGVIAQFRKDSTIVGTVGTSSGDLTIGTNDVSLRFSDGANAIFAVNSSGAARDAATDLGFSSIRFKDLYLSGGVYLGGAVAANLLDDYEEGTWTGKIADAASAGNESSSVVYGYYVKIGQLVYVHFNVSNIDTTGLTAGNDMYITGLPFASKSVTGNAKYTGTAHLSVVTFSGTPFMDLNESSTAIRIGEVSSAAGVDHVVVSQINSGTSDIHGNLCYQTA